MQQLVMVCTNHQSADFSLIKSLSSCTSPVKRPVNISLQARSRPIKSHDWTTRTGAFRPIKSCRLDALARRTACGAARSNAVRSRAARCPSKSHDWTMRTGAFRPIKSCRLDALARRTACGAARSNAVRSRAARCPSRHHSCN